MVTEIRVREAAFLNRLREGHGVDALGRIEDAVNILIKNKRQQLRKTWVWDKTVRLRTYRHECVTQEPRMIKAKRLT